MIVDTSPSPASRQDAGTSVSFTVPKLEVPKAIEVVEQKLRGRFPKMQISSETELAKVSIVGVGMRSHPGVAAKLFKGFADAGVNIDMISTSEIKVACVVEENDGPKAVKVAHKAFGLEKPRHVPKA